jgi:7-cyano-7-deazaguanine synthase
LIPRGGADTIAIVMASVVLLSGGLDSCVAFRLALDQGGVALALTVDYGQRAARRESEAAAAMATRFSVPHKVVPAPWLGEITRTTLVDRGEDVPRPSAQDLDSERAHETAKKVWVPNRNGILVAIAAAFAESLGAATVVVGFNREEAATFPDNSSAFVDAANAALGYSTLSRVRVLAPTGAMDKVEIVRAGRAAGAPIDLVWSCYMGGDEHCGTCESCLRFARAIAAAGETSWFEVARDSARRTLGRPIGAGA